mmetsp:Transcript_52242/g.138482  ORF Transcript_52242/g.138482 Transcript_52242/m.138482 type:complete len:219 (-) Transcript_52242:558-1214(-)
MRSSLAFMSAISVRISPRRSSKAVSTHWLSCDCPWGGRREPLLEVVLCAVPEAWRPLVPLSLCAGPIGFQHGEAGFASTRLQPRSSVETSDANPASKPTSRPSAFPPRPGEPSSSCAEGFVQPPLPPCALVDGHAPQLAQGAGLEFCRMNCHISFSKQWKCRTKWLTMHLTGLIRYPANPCLNSSKVNEPLPSSSKISNSSNISSASQNSSIRSRTSS